MDLLKVHAGLTWLAYLLGALASLHVATVGYDQVFAVSVVVIHAASMTWMLHAWVATSSAPLADGHLKAGLTFAVAALFSLSWITLAMFGLFVDVTANGLEGLNVEAYISALMPGLAAFALTAYLFSSRISRLGRGVDEARSRPTWLLWLASMYFLIGAVVVWRQVELIRGRAGSLAVEHEGESATP